MNYWKNLKCRLKRGFYLILQNNFQEAPTEPEKFDDILFYKQGAPMEPVYADDDLFYKQESCMKR